MSLNGDVWNGMEPQEEQVGIVLVRGNYCQRGTSPCQCIQFFQEPYFSTVGKTLGNCRFPNVSHFINKENHEKYSLRETSNDSSVLLNSIHSWWSPNCTSWATPLEPSHLCGPEQLAPPLEYLQVGLHHFLPKNLPLPHCLRFRHLDTF